MSKLQSLTYTLASYVLYGMVLCLSSPKLWNTHHPIFFYFLFHINSLFLLRWAMHKLLSSIFLSSIFHSSVNSTLADVYYVFNTIFNSTPPSALFQLSLYFRKTFHIIFSLMFSLHWNLKDKDNVDHKW